MADSKSQSNWFNETHTHVRALNPRYNIDHRFSRKLESTQNNVYRDYCRLSITNFHSRQPGPQPPCASYTAAAEHGVLLPDPLSFLPVCICVALPASAWQTELSGCGALPSFSTYSSLWSHDLLRQMGTYVTKLYLPGTVIIKTQGRSGNKSGVLKRTSLETKLIWNMEEHFRQQQIPTSCSIRSQVAKETATWLEP